MLTPMMLVAHALLVAAQPAHTEASKPAEPKGARLTCPKGTSLHTGAPAAVPGKPMSAPTWVSICERPDGTREGPYASWIFEGLLDETGTYANGQMEGDWTAWQNQERGWKDHEGHFRHGKATGHWRFFHDGILFEEGDLVDGRREGSWTSYQGADTSLTIPFHAGLPEGEWVMRQGKRIGKGPVSGLLPDGTWTFDDGRKSFTAKFAKGELVEGPPISKKPKRRVWLSPGVTAGQTFGYDHPASIEMPDWLFPSNHFIETDDLTGMGFPPKGTEQARFSVPAGAPMQWTDLDTVVTERRLKEPARQR